MAKPSVKSTKAPTKAKPKAKTKPAPRAAAKTATKPKAKAKPPSRKPKRARPKDVPRRKGVLIDLATLVITRDAEVPDLETTPDGRPIVAWACLDTSNRARGWIAQLSAARERVDRAFVDQTTSRKRGYEATDDGHFSIEFFFAQEHALAAGVYEAVSRCKPIAPAGYQGRAALDVHADGSIEIVAMGPRSPSPSRELEVELLRRIAIHDAREDRATTTDERRAEIEVRNDDVIERHGLPDLQGSEKQVRWAIDVRTRTFDLLVKRFPNRLEEMVAVIRTLTSAKWWIDHRDQAHTKIPGMLDQHIE